MPCKPGKQADWGNEMENRVTAKMGNKDRTLKQSQILLKPKNKDEKNARGERRVVGRND